ncbi:hypothetical protein DPEC_G00345020 [Dallia pectoralis]|uniref:Uncharacterized protein n=1 Tax=Dallia pectoralis TaxID=75939 RepID=A0ACC2F3J9_DALPE|nr:hypothetical protein DPEC_G00345020 [Dallia pectoralis]
MPSPPHPPANPNQTELTVAGCPSLQYKDPKVTSDSLIAFQELHSSWFRLMPRHSLPAVPKQIQLDRAGHGHVRNGTFLRLRKPFFHVSGLRPRIKAAFGLCNRATVSFAYARFVLARRAGALKEDILMPRERHRDGLK